MLLTNSLRSITIETNGTATTTEPSYSTSVVDTMESGEQTPLDLVGALTGATAVSVVPAIGSGVRARTVCGIAVTNRDTVSHTVTVKKVSAGTGYQIYKATLGAGESMNYDGSSWTVHAASGEVKQSASSTSLSATGMPNGATVTAAETGVGTVHQTVLTLTATPVTMRDTEQGGGVKIYDFPEGRIAFLGAVASIAVTTTSVLADTLNAGVTCNYGVGSTTQASATLATTEQDIVQVAAFTSSATINVAGAVAKAAGAATALDGTTTPIDAYLNLAVAGATDIDANATVTVSGTVTLNWINLGDA